MPTYSSSIPCTSISPGDMLTLWNAESPVTGQASMRFTVAAPYGDSVSGIAIAIKFSGAPGTFEIDVQDADTDADSNYLTVPVGGVVTAVDATNFTARVELCPFVASFGRLLMKDDPSNSVTVTATVIML